MDVFLSSSKLSSPEYIVLDEDDNEIKINDSPEVTAAKITTTTVMKKRKYNEEENEKKSSQQQEPKKQKCRFDLKKLPTLLPQSELRIEDFNKEKDIDIKEFLNEWKEQNLDELLLIDEYPFKDPLIKKLSPHESYAYVLGLNLVLDNVTNSYKNSLNWLTNKHKKQIEKQPTAAAEAPMSYNLHLGIENEEEFFKNLEKNTTEIKTMNKTLMESQLLKYKCKICEYRTDSLHLLDQHLTHPHNLNTKGLVTYRDTFTTLKCNFCPDFKTFLKEEYAKHINIVHRRKFISIKPNCAYNCQFCDYECREKLRFQRHLQQCSNNNEEFLKIVQRPTLDDEFEYELMFPTSKLIVNRRIIEASELKPIMNNNNNNNRSAPNHVNSISQRQLAIKNLPSEFLNDSRIAHILSKQNLAFKNSKIQPNPSGMNIIRPVSSLTTVNVKQLKSSESNASPFPKYLICPICNVSISNIVDLSKHIRQAHNLNEKTANTIINERVIPQLSKLTVLKDNNTQSPSIINITNAKKTSPNTITQITRPNSNQFISKTINFNTSNGLSTKIKVIDYVTELKLINNYLTISKKIGGKLNEVKTIGGKCFLCEHKTVYDLLQHFKYQHNLTVNCKRFETLCLLCGHSCCNRKELIAHQYQSHKMISFVSINKVFTLTKHENTDKERKEIESKLLELKQMKKNNVSNCNKNNNLVNIKTETRPVKVSVEEEEEEKVVSKVDIQQPTETVVVSTVDVKSEGSTVRKYTCNECTMIFEDFYAYCSHLINAHQDSIKSNLKCPICKNYFHNGQPYQNHIRTHLKICQIEVKRLNLDKPKPVMKSKNEKIAVTTKFSHDESLVRMKQKTNNLNIKDIQIVLNKFNPSQKFVKKVKLNEEVIVIDE